MGPGPWGKSGTAPSPLFPIPELLFTAADEERLIDIFPLINLFIDPILRHPLLPRTVKRFFTILQQFFYAEYQVSASQCKCKYWSYQYLNVKVSIKLRLTCVRSWVRVRTEVKIFQISHITYDPLLSDYRGMAKWFGAHYNQVGFSSAVKWSVRKDPRSQFRCLIKDETIIIIYEYEL